MKSGMGQLNLPKRKAIHLAQDQLVREGPLESGENPLLFEPVVDGLNLVQWATENRKVVLDKLQSAGAILFRAFNIRSIEEFEQFMTGLSGELLDYSYRSTPRTLVSGKIYTSTEYPAHQTIPLHNEMSYSRQWPMILGFFCVEPAAQGGETPIVDSRKVFERIDPKIRELFARKNVMYVRNYGAGLDLPWQDVFQTDNRAEVEDYCHRVGIGFEWKSEDQLRTTQVCQSVATHPATAESVWFNQAHLFHVSSLKAGIRESLLASVDDEPPRNAFFGDGSEIEDSMLDHIREVYEQEKLVFPWQKGDVLLVDNMLTAHGRKPYSGARKIVVGMAQSFGNETA